MVDDTDHCTWPITIFNSLEAGVCLAVPENWHTPEIKNPHIKQGSFIIIAIRMD